MESVLANSLSGSQVYRWAHKEDSGNSRPHLRHCSNRLSSCEASIKLRNCLQLLPHLVTAIVTLPSQLKILTYLDLRPCRHHEVD